MRRSINFNYQCTAVDLVKIGKRGQFFYGWYIYLYSGLDRSWLKPHLNDLVQRIHAAHRDSGAIEINGIIIGAPGQKNMVFILGT